MTAELKTCNTCGSIKLLTEFTRDSRIRKDGRVGICKACKVEAGKRRREAERVDVERTCKVCGVEKPIAEFPLNGGGYRIHKCKDCFNLTSIRRDGEHERTPDGMKICRTCKVAKPDSEYHYSDKRLGKRFPSCIKCAVAANRLRKYGVAPEEFEYMLQDQEHACKVCRDPFDTVIAKHVHVDHCHTTGKVRGVLCASCNKGLGMFRDNPSFLREAALHVEQFQGS